MKQFILLSLMMILSSCSQSFDFDEAEKLIKNIKEDGRIYRFLYSETFISINGQKTLNDQKEIAIQNKKGFNFKFRNDYLNSINVTPEEFESFQNQFKKTNAYSVDCKNNQAYFIMTSFLDGSKGYFYSPEDAKKNGENKEKNFTLYGGNIEIMDKVKSNWYKARAWH